VIFARELPSLFIVEFVCLFFSFRFFRKTPSPVLAPKEPEKSPERLAKGSKSSKDLKRLVTMVLLFFYFIANNNEGRYFCEEQSFIISVGKPGFFSLNTSILFAERLVTHANFARVYSDLF